MRRLLDILSYLCVFVLVVGTAQSVCSQSLPVQNADKPSTSPVELQPRSLVPIHTPAFNRFYKTRLNSEGKLTPRGLAHHLSRLYRYQADLIEAEATNDTVEVEAVLEQAMNRLQTLIQHPQTIHEPRVRELYQMIVSEYESYHGSSDTLGLAQGEIFSFRDTLFTALDKLERPLLEDVMMPQLPPMRTSVPMEVNRLVEQSISYLLEKPDRHLHHWISRASTYFPMVEKVLKEEGAPDELKYLAMIESGLNPQARSWASAVGMWQFMRSTGRLYDLKVNHWVDERRDPEKATRAAARHLKDLHEMFDDWHLAIAAYNCGAGRMRRSLRTARRRTGKENPSFWDVWDYLPRETRNYVPMYIATSLVVSNQEKFEIKEVSPGPAYEYDLVPIEGMIDLKKIASLANTDPSTIRALNPEIRRWATPPSDGPYMIRIPLGSYPEFAKGYADLPDDMKRSVTEYRVKKGDTLGEVARRFGVSINKLKRANNIRGHIIRIGQRLMVPVPNYSSDSDLMASAEPMSVQYAANRIRPIRFPSEAAADKETPTEPEAPEEQAENTKTETAKVQQASATTEQKPEKEAKESSAQEKQPEKEKIVYRVKRGDTLGEIADRHDIWVRQLRSWNNLRGSTIRVGQKLVIYASSEAAARASRENKEKLLHAVRSGDTLGRIAQRYGVSVQQLKAWNNLRGTRITAGEKLVVYTENSSQASVYQVQPGDSLYVIAEKHGISVTQLKRWNDLSSNRIQPGQTLRISG